MKKRKIKQPPKPIVPGRRVFYHRTYDGNGMFRLAYRDDDGRIIYLGFWQRLMFSWFRKNPK